MKICVRMHIFMSSLCDTTIDTNTDITATDTYSATNCIFSTDSSIIVIHRYNCTKSALVVITAIITVQ